MPEIKCSDLTDTNCNFIAKGETAEETKNNFYQHGAESTIHAEKYKTASEEEKAEFGKKVDEYLSRQS